MARDRHPAAGRGPRALYEIRYLQLHLTDDQPFTFPSRAFPDLPTPDRHYTLDELRALERFAQSRGVTLVPELDVPGHSTPMRRVRPFGVEPGHGVIDMASEAVYEAFDQLVGEICEVFGSTPYFHIGADESDLGGVGSTDRERAYMRAHGLVGGHDLYLHLIVRMNEIVKAHGKQMLLWEGFRGSGSGSPRVEIPTDVLVFGWETLYELPQNRRRNGYTVVNGTWKPLYVVNDKRWSPLAIYRWNPYLRVTTLHNSANPGLHIVELRVD